MNPRDPSHIHAARLARLLQARDPVGSKLSDLALLIRRHRLALEAGDPLNLETLSEIARPRLRLVVDNSTAGAQRHGR